LKGHNGQAVGNLFWSASDTRSAWEVSPHFWGRKLKEILADIWRFPSLAYEHGGGKAHFRLIRIQFNDCSTGAFLIPYLTCSFIVGLPLLYLEMSLGQFSQSGPAVVYGRIRPLFQGSPLPTADDAYVKLHSF
jgi:hypothetical protein